jgi:hypothetical protein
MRPTLPSLNTEMAQKLAMFAERENIEFSANDMTRRNAIEDCTAAVDDIDINILGRHQKGNTV